MRGLDELHVYDDVEPKSAAMNMALDEALLETADAPSLRFYRWRRASLSFGYFGFFADAAGEGEGREIVRRWTGGGIVLHGDDLTYSFVLPLGRPRDPAGSSPRAIYYEIHEAVRRALGQPTDVILASEAAPKVSEACFANPVEADVLLAGRKIAGAAQRRTRLGLLQQGSIQYEALPPTFTDSFAATLCGSFERKVLAPLLLERAEKIARRKYGTVQWLQRR